MTGMRWRLLAQVLLLAAVVDAAAATSSPGGENAHNRNYLEVLEGNVTYACLPLTDAPPETNPTSGMRTIGSFESFSSSVIGGGGSSYSSAPTAFKSSLSSDNSVQLSSVPATVTVTVTSLQDDAVNTSACSSTPSPSHPCSFRSALLLCSELLTSSISHPSNISACVVSLPEQGKVIHMDPLQGEVSLTSFVDDSPSSSDLALQGTLSVLGNGCTVSLNTSIVTSSGQASRLLRLVLPSPSQYIFHLHLENFTIANFGNSSLEGGGIYLANLGSSSLSSMTFQGNSGSNGGGVWIDSSSDIVFQSCVFQENNASIYGAGVFIHTYSLRISFSNCSFVKNMCVEDGGGVHVRTSNDYVSFTGCEFLHNEAYEDGAGVYVRQRNDYMSFVDCIFHNNFAVETGGGVYIRSDNYYTSFESCDFASNYVYEGGGAVGLRSNNYYMTWTHCTFRDNKGGFFGGAMYLVTYNSDFEIRFCIFENNFALYSYGGAIYIVSLNRRFLVSNSMFIANAAGQAGGAIFSSTFNSNLLLENSVFDGNVATIYGGTLYMGIDHDDLVISNCNISNSSADTGGAFYISSFNDNVFIDSCKMVGNFARHGGAISSYTHSMRISSSEFINNHAYTAGLGVFSSSLPDEGRLLLSNNTIANNFAEYDSGAISIFSFNIVLIENCEILNNSAYGTDAGALKVVSVNKIKVTDSSFENNNCYRNGGALYVDIPESNNSDIRHSSFINNTAHSHSGGAVYVVRTRQLQFHDLSFIGNTASDSGGAVTARSSNENINVTKCTFRNNLAVNGDGSALHVADGNSFMDIKGCTFLENKAPSGAGTVFWTYSFLKFLEPAGLHESNEFAPSNTAKYGPYFATQGIELLFSDNDTSSIAITDYVGLVPSFTVTLVDYYKQVVLSQSEKEVTATVLPSNCYHSAGYLTGNSIVIWNQGVATFDRLQAYCAPGYKLNLLIKYDSSEGNVDPKRNMTLVYRQCVRGEYLAQERACSLCTNGSYSLTEPAEVGLDGLRESQVCKVCPEHAENCYGDNIFAVPGYWRNSDVASTLQECPFGEPACGGGGGVEDGSCEEGFEGPLCAVCQRDFIYSPFTRTCTECNSSFVEVVILIVFFVLVAFFAYFYCWKHYSALKKECGGETMGEVFSHLVIRSKLLGENVSAQDKIKLEDRWDVVRKRVIGLIRVFLTYFQVITILPIVLAMSDFDLLVTETFLPFEITVNFEISYLMRGIDSCSNFSQSWDAISSLYFSTAYPIVVLLLLCGMYFVHSRMSQVETQATEKSHGLSEEVRMSRLLRRYVFVSLLFLYMIFPSVSAVIFSMFSCSDSDPDEVTSGHDEYLQSDYSISCASTRYRAAKAYAILMVFLYPIGIPSMFMGVLYYYREGIMVRTRVDKVHQPCYVIEFLWFPFTPSFWYFECIDIVYRVSLTGFLVLIKQGSAEQIVVGMVLSFFYAQLHQHILPHEDKWVQNIKIISIWQIFIFLFIVLLIEKDILVGQNAAVSAVVLANCFFPFLLALSYMVYLYWRYQELKKTNKHADESDDNVMDTEMGSDIDMVTLVLRTTICTMRDSSRESRSTIMFDKDNISLVDMKQRKSDRIDE